MRLFIAINFDNITKNMIINTQKSLSENALKVKLTKEENLHLTLIFLGETPLNRIENIKKAMNNINSCSFEIRFNKIGSFKKNGGDIWWIGAEHNNILNSTQKKLATSLFNDGFNVEKREFTPHITLARETLLKDNFDKSQIGINLLTKVKSLSLMKSEHINGKLTYTEIFTKGLNINAT